MLAITKPLSVRCHTFAGRIRYVSIPKILFRMCCTPYNIELGYLHLRLEIAPDFVCNALRKDLLDSLEFITPV
jgi:hypothetical protein